MNRCVFSTRRAVELIYHYTGEDNWLFWGERTKVTGKWAIKSSPVPGLDGAYTVELISRDGTSFVKFEVSRMVNYGYETGYEVGECGFCGHDVKLLSLSHCEGCLQYSS